MDFVIRLRSAVALIGRFPVLAGVDLDVAAGEVVLVEGPNGAGKTSLLRACAGLLRVASGQIEVLGADLASDPRSVRRRVGWLGHASGLYDDMTAEDNIRFALRSAGANTNQAAPAMDLMGITGRLAKTPAGGLSAGQRRRVSLAGIVARDPELWLLDEPHAGLDAEHRDLLDAVVLGASQRGATVLFASHEHERASALAKRCVRMAGGAITAPLPSLLPKETAHVA